MSDAYDRRMGLSAARQHGPRGVALIAIAVTFAACSGGAGDSAAATSAASGGAVKTITMAAVGKSGVFGTATFSDSGTGQTQVVIDVEANLNRDMPGAVTLGACPVYDESTVYYLNDTREGKSTSLIPVSIDALTKRPFSVHIDTAPDDATVAACGDIK